MSVSVFQLLLGVAWEGDARETVAPVVKDFFKRNDSFAFCNEG